jgi:hypothetical protein
MAAIVAVPLFALIQQDYTWTRPDTRVIAKDWIEANIPAGAKFLMDGMRYRFIHSPPLNPDQATVNRRTQGVADADYVSRGISSSTLDLYERAMTQISGPKYELHSTGWGLDVQDLSHYEVSCFDYIVTSSSISSRFIAPERQQKYPASARFYQQLPENPRVEAIFSSKPAPWKIQGPAITIYKILNACD